MKVIQIGMGGMGDTWLKTVRRSSEVEFAGFVEINDAIAARQAETYGFDRETIFTSLPEALEQLDADGVIDVTPPQFHKANSLIALDAGVPVLSEKPLSDNLADARAIVDKANDTGVLHMVAQNYRYRAFTQTVKSVLESGELGPVASVHAEFFAGPRFGGFREEMAQPLLVDMSIHHFDLMRFFLNSNASRVHANSWNPPWSWFDGDASAEASIQFADGVIATYSGSWASRGRETSWNAHWRFECERGVLMTEHDVIAVQRALSGAERGAEPREQYSEIEIVPQPEMARESQDYLLHEFYEAVTMGKPIATSAHDNIGTIELVFGIVAACYSGAAVELG